MRETLLAKAAELTRSRVPFVQATVVRAEHPTSAHAGDTALVRADGRIEGFVGGDCAEGSVRVHALNALASGEPRLLRIRPGTPKTTVEEGAVNVTNPCLSGGSLEIFLEPRRPAPRLVVIGDTPVALALAALGDPLGYAVDRVSPTAEPPDDWADTDAVVVASHGRGEEPILVAALQAGVGYVGLVASRKRASAVLASLDVTEAQRRRVHSPAGLDIGARTAPEIALSILAELVEIRAVEIRAVEIRAKAQATAGGPVTAAPPAAAPPATVVDPICGMSVAVTATALSVPAADGGRVYFCGDGCRRAYLAGPGAHATAS